MRRQKIILDVDTGTDDAVAIMLAGLHAALDLVACTSVNGNVDVTQASDNTLRVLELIGRTDVPVFEGLHRPIVRPDFPIPRSVRNFTHYIHGIEMPFGSRQRVSESRHAVNFLIDTFRNASEEIILVALGPLSNIAAAIAMAPDFVGLVPEIMMMGGAHSLGNATPSAGFNTWSDPEAAASVLQAGFKKITMVPIDATHKALITRADCGILTSLGTPAAVAAACLIERRIVGHEAGQPMHIPESAPVHDPVCIAAIIDERVISTDHIFVDVETRGDLTLGRTVMDVSRRSGTTPNCHVAFKVDRDLFISILNETLRKRPPHADFQADR